MGKQGSYAFRPGQPGSILDVTDTAAAVWDEPTAVEREIALGYAPGSTAAEGLSERERCAALGQCMDANASQAIMASCYAWWFREHGAGTAIASAAAPQLQQQWQQQHAPVHSAAAAGVAATATAAPCISSSYPWQHAVYTAAAAQGTIAAGGSSNDIWTDHLALSALQQGQLPAGLSAKERDRIQQRLKYFRFAAPGQVVTDNGVEFTEGAFAQLLLDCLIDHGTTSVQHPRANGQAEKAVDTVKQALRKMCLDKYRLDEWDTDVAWLCLGYNCSPHSSHSFTPYELMYARPPVVPPAVRSSISQPLDLDDPAAAAADLLARKQLVQQRCPAAMANLPIA
uniref:Integrase catalytic domain-containing protein n=1 Tax=Tetradesmus obliquus TaxID=3088 RepID=A0A383WKL0_TETOB